MIMVINAYLSRDVFLKFRSIHKSYAGSRGLIMIKRLSISLIAFLFLSCDVVTNLEKEPDNLIVGSRTGVLVQTSPSLADSIFKDYEHIDTREINLNNDLTNEFYIVSEEDSVFESASNDFLYFRKNLRIEKNSSYEGRVSVVTDNDGNIKVFNLGEVVNPEIQSFQIINGEKHFCDFSIDVNQQALNYGYWNEKTEKYFVVTTRYNDIEVAAWIKVSVSGFDNYVFFGFASFNTNWATYND